MTWQVGIGGTIEMLFERASESLSPAEMDKAAGMGDSALRMVDQLRCTLEGVGCLVRSDIENSKAGAGWRCGSLQGDDVPELLFLASNVLDTAGGLLRISSDAELKARTMRDHARESAGASNDSVDLISELQSAHVIVRNALQLMTPEQKSEWGKRNDADGVGGEGVTRANERLAVIRRASGGAV